MGSHTWDLVVIGGGTAGIVTSTTAARLGARVALVESERTGGDCLWTGCVPSKALIAAAATASSARRAPEKGIDVQGVDVDFARVMAGVRASIAAIAPVDSPQTLSRKGVRVISGRAAFADASTLLVDGAAMPFRRAVLCTGASPSVPDVPGLRAAASTLTSDSVWDLDELPDRLLVMGGGSIGCELGQAFARLGARVTVVEAADRLLPQEDPEASALVEASLRRDDVTVLTATSVLRVEEPDGQATVVHVDDGAGGTTTIDVDAVLVAVGRRARTDDLGLAAAGIDVADSGAVVVDQQLRTTNPRVWAAGDVTALPAFTHVAGVHGTIAATNALLGLRRKVDLSAVPRVTFTDPEVAAVGVTGPGSGKSPRTRSVRVGHADVDRAVVDGRTEGFSRLLLDRRRRIVGATLVGPRAGESLAEVTLAIRRGAGVGVLTSTMHPYPTYGDGVWNAAIGDSRERLDHPLVRGAIRLLLALRRGAG